MAELKQAQCSRRGYLTHLKKLLQSAEELLSRTGTLSNDDVAALRDLHEQLQRKQDLITALDVKILEATKGDDEIEAEVLQSEETASAISTTKAKIISRLNRIASAEVTTTSTHATSPAHTMEHHADHARENITRLPKLDLPYFEGNPLNWQPFWDCFQAAVELKQVTNRSTETELSTCSTSGRSIKSYSWISAHQCQLH